MLGLSSFFVEPGVGGEETQTSLPCRPGWLCDPGRWTQPLDPCSSREDED